jgi:hypothetical protein
MHKEEKNKLIAELLTTAGGISVVPAKNGGVDAFCAAAGLYQILKFHNKSVFFIYPEKLPEGCEGFVDSAEIIADVKRRELLVSIDYAGTDVDKLSYSTDDGVFFLKLAPVHRNFGLDRIKAELTGNKSDVFIVVGAQAPEDLGQLREDLKEEMLEAKIINLDIVEKNSRFGHFNLVDPLVDSLSLLVMQTVSSWDLTITSHAAKAFLTGISKKKNI